MRRFNVFLWSVSFAIACLIGDSAAEPGKDTPDSNFALWTNGKPLNGANIYVRRTYPSLDDPAVMGNGPTGPRFRPSDFESLRLAGADYVHIGHPGIFTESPPFVVDTAMEESLDQLLDMANDADLKAVIAFRTGPGRSEFDIHPGSDFESDPDKGWFPASFHNQTLWKCSEAQDAFLRMWDSTSRKFRAHPAVVGYELLVEPNSSEVIARTDDPAYFSKNYAGTLADWNQLYSRVVAALRDSGDRTPILVGGNGYSSVKWLKHIKVSNRNGIVYVAHSYEPFSYTHQGSSSHDSLQYPCTDPESCHSFETPFDRAWLVSNVGAQLEMFQRKHGAPVAVTEFGAHRWSPGLDRYFRDMIELLDELEVSHAIWEWSPANSPYSRSNDSFNYQFGPDARTKENVSSQLLQSILNGWHVQDSDDLD